MVTTRSAGANLRAVRKTLRALARTERLDDIAAALGVLLVTSAELADLVTSDDPANDCPVYARARVLQVHAAMLGQLHEMAGPVVEDSAFERLMAAMTEPSHGSSDGPDGRWD